MHNSTKYILSCFLVASLSLSAHQLDTEYSKEFTDLVEYVYGTELLSQGGTESIDLMIEGLDLDGKKLLDIGSGLGGVDFYLAKKYKVAITGVDCVSRMVQDASDRKLHHHLRGTVDFVHQDPEQISYPFPDATFDVIISKEAFLHIPDKGLVLKELSRVLKPGGQLIILDWLVQTHDLGPNITEMMEVDGLDLKMATLLEYTMYIQRAGLDLISGVGMNGHYIRFTADNIATIKSKEQLLLQAIGQESYDYSLKTWGIQKKIFEGNEVVVTLLKATKP